MMLLTFVHAWLSDAAGVFDLASNAAGNAAPLRMLNTLPPEPSREARKTVIPVVVILARREVHKSLATFGELV